MYFIHSTKDLQPFNTEYKLVTCCWSAAEVLCLLAQLQVLRRQELTCQGVQVVFPRFANIPAGIKALSRILTPFCLHCVRSRPTPCGCRHIPTVPTYVRTYNILQHNRSSEQHTHSKPDTLQREGSTGYSDMKDGVFTGGNQEYHRICSTCTYYSPYTHAQLIHCTYSKAHAYRMQAKYASSTYIHTAVAKGHRKDYLTHTSPLNYARMSSPCRYVHAKMRSRFRVTTIHM